MMNHSLVVRVGISTFLLALTHAHAQVPPPPGPAQPLPPPPGPAQPLPPREQPEPASPPVREPSSNPLTGAAQGDVLRGANPEIAESDPPAVAEEATGDSASGADATASASVEVGASSDELAAPEEPDARSRGLLRHGSLRASTGIFHTQDAGSGPEGTFRFGLLTSYMAASGFLCPQCETFDGGPGFLEDDMSRVSAHVQLSVTPLPFLEAYWALHSTATSNSLGTPELLQVVGDTTWGAKAFTHLEEERVFTAGGALELWMLNGAGDIGIDNASIAVRALGSADFTKWSTRRMPFRANINLSYVFDNSGNLVEAAEANRRERITRIERFGLNINRVDRFVPAVGIEGVFEYVHPFLEWSIDIPANRQGYRCIVSDLGPSEQCLETYESFSATPSRLTVGARGYALLDGLSAVAALDIATGGVNAPFWEEVQPEAPWNLYLGLSFAVDTVPQAPEAVPAPTVEAGIEQVIAGRVIEEGSDDTPVSNAIVRYQDRPLTGMVADEQGQFESRPLEPGEYQLHVSAAGYESATCAATIAELMAREPTADVGAPQRTPVVCALKAKPKVGNIDGVVLNDDGSPVAEAKVTVTDKLGRSLSLQVDEAGAFRFENVPPGETIVRISAPGHLTTTRKIDVPSGQDLRLDLDLVRSPTPPNVSLNGQQILLSKPLEFRAGSKELLPSAAALLDEIAMLLTEHPELGVVEVQAHTSNEAPQVISMQLSQDRASTVVEQLVARGVAAERLRSQGYGDSQPIAPNTTEAGRTQNERIQLVVVSGQQGPNP